MKSTYKEKEEINQTLSIELLKENKQYRMDKETLALYPDWQQRRHLEAMVLFERKHEENSNFPEVVTG